MCIFGIVPIIIYYLSKIALFCSESNDWVGFWGSYIGAIVGACVAIYVLMKTLRDNKKMQTRMEVIEFCNCITEKCATFVQKYEETVYEAHTYVVVRENQSERTKEEFDMYRKFLESNHCAKAIIYEIESYLSVRDSRDVFYTPNFKMTIEAARSVYNELKRYEENVGSVLELKALNDSRLVNEVEEFLNIINQYEKDLLNKLSNEKDKEMKTLEEIYEEVNKCVKNNKRENKANCYLERLKEEIGDDKVKLLIYKDDCNQKMDLNMSTYLMASISTVISIASFIIALIALILDRINDQAPEMIVNVVCIIIPVCAIAMLAIPTLYYTLVIKHRKKYSLIALIIEQIEQEMKDK